MLAALLVEPGRIVIDEIAVPEIGPGDVRILVGGVGLCGSDLSVYSGRWPAPSYPWIMGHEAFGTIEAVGKGVDPARIGELVVVEPNQPCGACRACSLGWTSACGDRRSVGMNRPGALAEMLTIPAQLAWPVGAIAPHDLVCVEPLAVVETALRRLTATPPDEALVVGVGAQGLLMCVALVRRGVRVHVTDIRPERVAFAIDRLLVAGPSDEDQRFGLVIDSTGQPAAVTEAVRRCEIGATLLELGLERRPFELSAETLVRRQLVIRGSLTYDHPEDFRRTIELVSDERLSPGRAISDEFPFIDTQVAFDASLTAPGKTWIRSSGQATQ